MSSAVESSAFVLDCREYRETSQLIVLLTEQYGRVDVVARGSRKARSGPPDRFSRIYAVWLPAKQDGALGTLTRWEFENEFPRLRDSYTAYLFASVWAEAVLALTARGAEDRPSFELTAQFLEALSQELARDQPSWGLLRRLWQLFEIHGYAVAWRECCRCGASAGMSHFSWDDMSPVCGRCVGATDDVFPLSEALASGLVAVGRGTPWQSRPSRATIEEFLILFDEAMRRVADKRLPSLALLRARYAPEQ